MAAPVAGAIAAVVVMFAGLVVVTAPVGPVAVTVNGESFETDPAGAVPRP